MSKYPFDREHHHRDCTNTVKRMWKDTSKFNWACGAMVSFNWLPDEQVYELVWLDLKGQKRTMHGSSFEDAATKAMGWEIMTEVEHTMGGIDYA